MSNSKILPNGIKEHQLTPVDADDGSEYYIRKNFLNHISCSQVKDEVEGGYLINFKKPLPQFDTAFGKAYEASNRANPDQDVYGVILDKHVIMRLQDINKLRGAQFEHFANVIAAQVIPTSIGKGRSYAVILDKPKGIRLSEYVAKNGKFSEDYVVKKVVPAVNTAIVSLASVGVVHGKINADTVYIDDNGHFFIAECVSEPCGYSQPVLYETMNRATAMPMGKGSSNVMVDYYALGVLASVLIRGKSPVEGMTAEEVLARKFEKGIYDIVTEGLELFPLMLDLLRGVLNESKVGIWGIEQMADWVKGRRFNLLAPSDHVEAVRPIIFNDKKYSHRRHLVHDMYLHWDKAKQFVKQDTIIKWIDKGGQDDDLVEYLEMLSSRYGREKELPGFDRDDELLAQYILLLDPNGPVRLREFSASIEALGGILAYGFAFNKRYYIEGIEHIILRHLLSIMTSHKDVVSRAGTHEIFVSLQKCNDLLRKNDMGFGIERCLYEMNPTLPCQSPAVVDDLIFTTKEMLRCLNENESIGGKVLDKHMAAFLSERMDLLIRIHISSFSRFPEFAGNVYIQVLALLSLAQQTSKIGELPKLCHKVYDGLKNVVEEFYSKTIRENLYDALGKAVNKGLLSGILRVVSDPKYIVKDRLGFKKAVSKYKNNAIQVLKLSNAKIINTVGYRYGLQLAVMLSFFLATVEIMTLMIKAF